MKFFERAAAEKARQYVNAREVYHDLSTETAQKAGADTSPSFAMPLIHQRLRTITTQEALGAVEAASDQDLRAVAPEKGRRSRKLKPSKDSVERLIDARRVTRRIEEDPITEHVIADLEGTSVDATSAGDVVKAIDRKLYEHGVEARDLRDGIELEREDKAVSDLLDATIAMLDGMTDEEIANI